MLWATIELFIVTIAALIAEAIILHDALGRPADMIPYGMIHGGVLLTLGLWAITWAKRYGDWRLPGLLVVTTAVMGVLGPAGSLLVAIFVSSQRKTEQSFEKWYESLFPETTEDSADQLVEALTSRGLLETGNVVPFIDVLRDGTAEQKIMVTVLLTKHFRPAFAPALRMALADPEPGIRVQAATAAAQIEDRFLKQANALEQEMVAKPNDAEIVRKLAKHYDDYAFTGLFDKERERQNRRRALAANLDFLSLKPDDMKGKLAVGRLLLRERMYREAAAWIAQSFAADDHSPQVVLWQMECLFHLNRLAELRALAADRMDVLSQSIDLPPSAIEAARLWAGEAKAA